jgi:FAD/FMN-containing dehydrogenase
MFSRRAFLERTIKAATVVPALLSGAKNAAATDLPPFPKLLESEASLLTPVDRQFARYQPAYNRRTMLQPKMRAVCRTPGAIATMIQWLRWHKLPFAMRSGGHSFEGLSENDDVVIDVRRLDEIEVDLTSQIVNVGAGASLGAIYKAVAAHGYALPAGSCVTVGIAGHALGGGYGLLSRKFGLLCDSLMSLQLIDPEGYVLRADANENSDLFWASRGGGGGSFGVVTGLRFKIYPLDRLLVFSVHWAVSVGRALDIVKAWQAWAPHAAGAITSELRLSNRHDGKMKLVCEGQSVGSEKQLRRELKALLDTEAPQARPTLTRMSFLQAVDYFSEGWDYESHYSKDKSDFIFSPLGDDGLATLLAELQRLPRAVPLTVTFSAYGGRIAALASQDTAFPYRNALYCLHYELVWERATITSAMLAQIRIIYDAMRPYVSGAAYVNYCDKDLQNWQEAYWGPNLPRLKAIKSRFDPEGVFRHAQSI